MKLTEQQLKMLLINSTEIDTINELLVKYELKRKDGSQAQVTQLTLNTFLKWASSEHEKACHKRTLNENNRNTQPNETGQNWHQHANSGTGGKAN